MTVGCMAATEQQPGIFDAREGFLGALRGLLLRAATEGTRELCCLDADFMDWPWSDAPVLQALSDWARPGRRLRLLAGDFSGLLRRHPRFVQWRQIHDHLVTAATFEPEALHGVKLASMLLAPGAGCVRRFDAQQWRGAWSADDVDARRTEHLALD
ncbi:MAG TPA: hypothetical protein VGE47_14935, partial [Burkholderiaceae bacterium]